jgi:predicted ATPase with chaperone activity
MSNSNDSSETVSVDPDVEMMDLEPQSVAAAAADKENQTSLSVNRQTLATTTVNQSTAATTAAATTSGGGYRSPWVELYRPRTLSDVLGNEETILRLRAIAKDGNLPNLILCGPPGTGKCSEFECS